MSKMSTSVPDYKKELKKFKRSCDQFMQWRKKCDEKKSDIKVDVDFDEFHERLSKLQEKDDKKTIDIPVVGTTSSGKSLLINSLLRMELMESGVGHTTPGAVSVELTKRSRGYFKKTEADESEVQVDFFTEESRESFWSEIDNVSEERNEDIIRVFLPEKDIHSGSILRRHVSLIDSPGMERDCFQSDITKGIIGEADALIIVIDITSGANLKETTKMLEQSGLFVKPNVLTLFNKCDKLDKEQSLRRSKLIQQSIEELTVFLLKDKKNYKDEKSAKDTLFFISAKEANKARMSGSDLDHQEPSFGYTYDGENYNTDKGRRASAFSKFEKQLLSIACGNYESAKAKRMIAAIAESRKALLEKAQEVQSRLEAVNDGINKLIHNQKAFTVLEEARQLATFFYLKTYGNDGSSSASGKEKLSTFIEFCEGDESKYMRDAVKGICSSVDEHLEAFVSRTCDKGISGVFKDVREKHEENFAPVLEPIEEDDDDLNEQDSRLKELRKKRKKLTEKTAGLELDLLHQKLRQEEKRDLSEILLQTETLSSHTSHTYSVQHQQDLSGYVPAAVGAGLILGPIGALAVGAVGAAHAASATPQVEVHTSHSEVSTQAMLGLRYGRRSDDRESLKDKQDEKLKEKFLQIETERNKFEAKEKRIAKLERRRTEHINALSTFYRLLMMDIRDEIMGRLSSKFNELTEEVNDLKSLMRQHCE